MYASPFTVGRTVILRDIAHQVVGKLDESTIQLRCVDSGALWAEKVFNMLGMYVRGELSTPDIRLKRELNNVGAANRPLRLEQVSASAQAETRRRIEYLVRLDKLGAFTTNRDRLASHIHDVAVALGDARPPHVTTVYRWHERYTRCSGDPRVLVARNWMRGGKGQTRLDAAVEAFIHESIETMLEGSRTWSAEDLYLDVKNRIEVANLRRADRDKLPTPGLRTIQRRLTSVPAFDLAVARFGIQEAERRFARMGVARRVNRILEIGEIDHTPLDILVVNDERVVIGRPVITVILDRHSRCVLGYHLSLDGHGVETVFDAIHHALLPKVYLAGRYADLELEWPCFGWFTRLVMDNGLEFHANAVADALTNIGIVAEFAASREPNDKPHVERFLKTLNYSFIHRLPGTTFAKGDDRIGFRSEDEAALTLRELDRLIHIWICSKYHLRQHKGLRGRAPLAVWQESAAAFPPQLKCNAQDLDIEFAQTAQSSLQHYGIDLNTHRYNSPKLTELRKALPARTSVHVKWPRRDVGHIYVWDPLERDYFKVNNISTEFAGLSLDQAREVDRQRAANDSNNEVVMAQAGPQIRDVVAHALADKKLKRRREGARLAGHNSARIRQPQKSTPPTQDLPAIGPEIGDDEYPESWVELDGDVL